MPNPIDVDTIASLCRKLDAAQARLGKLLAAAEKAAGIWSVYAEKETTAPQFIVAATEELRGAVEAAKEGA